MSVKEGTLVIRFLPNYIIGMFVYYKIAIRDQFIGRISVNMAVFFLQRGDFFPFIVEGVL